MPIPQPTRTDTEDQYISRCVEFLVNEGTEEQAAIAICYQQWENKAMLIDKSQFKTKKDMLHYMSENKELLIAQKKSQLKRADGFAFNGLSNVMFNEGMAYKGTSPIDNPSEVLNVLAVINTTNWLDSHDDVHMPGLWDKTLQENRNILHVQEHKSNEHKYIISSGVDLKAYTKDFTWKELGFNAEGTTQALLFDSMVRRKRNEFMWNQYANGWVENHSVGMYYVKLFFCANDTELGDDFENWNKYLPLVANQEKVLQNGYFFAVTEAKLIEGSAVPIGSNAMTPSIAVNSTSLKETQSQIIEPGNHSQDKAEPDYSTLIKGINSIKF